MERRLHRSETNRMVGGVAGGLSEHFDWDPSLVRTAWVVLALFSGGLFLVLYFGLWIITPTYSRAYGVAQADAPATPPAPVTRTGNGPLVFGAIIIGAGVLALLSTTGIFAPWSFWSEMWRIWPVFLIAIGAAILLKR